MAGTAAGLGGVELYVPASICLQCGSPVLICCDSVLYALTLIVFGASLHHQRVRPTNDDAVVAPDAVPAPEADIVGADESPETKMGEEVQEV